MNLLCKLGIHQRVYNFHESQDHNGLLWLFYICPRCESRFGGFAPGAWNRHRPAWRAEKWNTPDGNKVRLERDARAAKIFERRA